ncbi:MAG: HEAT repeat domain-containing protein [Candidatus Omnitrophica bacterium]|nr:HEAT repeat domain-containing protein [Candidatus Omnitrophota bacterium]
MGKLIFNMVDLKDSSKIGGVEFYPEEEKNWPFYIRERFELFNSIQSLNFVKILSFLEKDPDLVSLDLFHLLALSINQSEKNKLIPEELLNKFVKLTEENHILNMWSFVKSCEKIGKPAIFLLKNLIKNNDDSLYVADLVVEVLVNLGDKETAWEVFNTQIKTSSEKLKILNSLLNLAKIDAQKIVEHLEPFKDDKDPFVLLKLVECLIKTNNLDEAFNILNNLVMKSKLVHKLSIIEFFYDISSENKNLSKLIKLKDSLIESLKNSNSLWDSLCLAEKLAEINSGEVDLIIEILQNAISKIAETEPTDVWLYEKIINIAEKIGENGLDILNLLRKNELKDVRIAVVKSLAKMGEKGMEILLDMINDPDEDVLTEIEAAIYQNKVLEKLKNNDEKRFLIKSLILRQEPFLANPFIIEIRHDNPLLKLYDIVNDLRKEYPNLIGLSILGSLSKGYWAPVTSDIDWGLIAEGEISQELINKFRERCEKAGFNLCYDNSLSIDNLNYQNPKNLEVAFNGLFLGDRQKLKKIQSMIINSITSEKWDSIRYIYNLNQEQIEKMMERFNFSKEDVDFIVSARKFLWSLPDYETAKKVFN